VAAIASSDDDSVRPIFEPALAGLVGLALLVSACGSSPGGAPRGAPTRHQALAYAGCLRSKGVPNWPDPDSSGAFDKSKLTLQQLGVQRARLQSAQTACQRLLPDGGAPLNQAGLRATERDALSFARCMRSHGVASWPDYTLRGGTPLFDLHGTTIAPNSPVIVATQLRCTSLLHLSSSPPTSGGARSGNGD
jgi:hypothetical protein